MDIKSIINFGHPTLRKKSIPVNDYNSQLHNIIDNMARMLKNREERAALAAPQIDILKRIVVIDCEKQYFELINPVIIDKSGFQTDFEGCLSFPGYIGKVSRANYIKVHYFDRDGKERISEQDGFLSRCFQHEIDHLDGILFIDRMQEDYLVNQSTNQYISLEKIKELTPIQ